MRRLPKVVAPFLLTALTALTATPAAAGSQGPMRSPPPSIVITAQPVLSNLAFPAAFTFDAAGRIFYGERFTGRIRVYDPANGTDHLLYTVTKMATGGEQGLLGLALDPKYPAKPFVYAYATRTVGGILRDQILKIQDPGGAGSLKRIIFSSDTVAGTYHDGGRILFGPDGRLYAVAGEGHSADNAQNLSNDAGKILRMNRRGRAPSDNPFTGSRIWAYGIRNSFGFTFDPQTGGLWETEAGPNCNDEINLIARGANYGWGPNQTCSSPPLPPANTNQDGPDPTLPIEFFTPVITPVGTVFCGGCSLTGSEGHLFFGAYNDDAIREAVLNVSRDDIVSITVAYTHTSGILSMERGPDRALYFSDASGIDKLVNA